LLPDIISRFAQALDDGVFPGDDSTITSAATGMDHVIHTAGLHEIDAGVLRAGLAVAQRAIEEGHGTDGFARLADVLARRS
jgi:hypothetical protein